ncbi:Transcription factor Iwr1 [Trinorchestia longiramus]|nr:Transcription factor Iwr1 [Trinorchestia longiramus]
MDVKIIRVKRSCEAEPLEQLNVSHKRRKLDAATTLSMVATVKSKDESLAPIIKDIVLKCKKDKLLRLEEKKGSSHPDLFKYRTSKDATNRVGVNAASAARRYQIVNKYRGITGLDDDSEKFLASTNCFHNEISSGIETSGSSVQSTSSSSREFESANTRVLDIEIVDVDEIPNEEDVICMNGEPLQTSYFYDIFLTQVPKGCSVDDFEISQAVHGSMDDAECIDSDDSEDSNAENYYTNDYPDEESHSSEEDEEDNYWDNELSSRMKRSLGFESGSWDRTEKKQHTFMGVVVPEHLGSMVDWGAFQSDDDTVSSIDGEREYSDMGDD